MVVRTIDMKAFLEKLGDAKEENIKEMALPKGVTKKMFRTFLRVMEAEDFSEISDIKAEEMAMLYVYTEDLIAVLYHGSLLEKKEQLWGSLEKTKAYRFRRRIL